MVAVFFCPQYVNQWWQKLKINFSLTGKPYTVKSLIQDTIIGNKIVDHADVVEASPVGAAPTTSSFSTEHLVSIYYAKTTVNQDGKHLSLGIWSTLY